jgi:hypothetical protein
MKRLRRGVRAAESYPIGLATRHGVSVPSSAMLFVTRIALQVMLLFALLSLLVAMGSPTSVPAEKVTLALVAAAVVWVAARVRGLDAV